MTASYTGKRPVNLQEEPAMHAIVPIIRMDGNAGAAVSGHRGKVSQPAE